MQVKDLTVEELKLLSQETVAETLHTLLIDPDEGKKLKPEVKQQLLDSLIIAHSKLPIHLAVL